MFEKAIRMKLRFPYKGSCSLEDLWDMSLGELDHLYKTLRSTQKATEEESLLSVKTKDGNILSLQIDIVKHVVETKLAEKEDKASFAQKKLKAEQLKSVLAERKEAELRNLPTEDLEKAIAELEQS